MNSMTYKDYTAVVAFDAEDRLFEGRVVGLRDVISFTGESVDELEREFHISVDTYLDHCAEIGKEPDRTYSGRVTLRLPPALHRALDAESQRTGRSLNDLVVEGVQARLSVAS
ncbi:MAG: type II toxin-antitoxin system HicB family antitoxin [Bacteroidota bacterium]